MKTILSKSDFAERMRRSPACVTKWIKLGKISTEALIGDGRAARIWVERAEADLAASLDPSQQWAQASPIMISPADPPPSALIAGATPAAPRSDDDARSYLSERERDLARRAKADADKAEHDAEAARRKLALDEGRYVIAADAAAAWGREMTKLISELDTFLGATLPRATADRHNLDWKTLASEFRDDWRAFRENLSESAKSEREAIEREALAE